MVAPIRQKTDPVLRQMATLVIDDLPSTKINQIIESMSQTLNREDDGVALAAPQIGVNKQIFVVSSKIFTQDGNEDQKGGKKSEVEIKMLVFINPKIVKRSRRKVKLIEGCLSVRGLYGHIKRNEKITVEALDENGVRFTRHTSGLLAQIVQHEIDHLNGIIFTDQAYDFIKVK